MGSSISTKLQRLRNYFSIAVDSLLAFRTKVPTIRSTFQTAHQSVINMRHVQEYLMSSNVNVMMAILATEINVQVGFLNSILFLYSRFCLPAVRGLLFFVKLKVATKQLNMKS